MAVLGEEGTSPESWTAAPYAIGTFPTALNWLADITNAFSLIQINLLEYKIRY